MKFRFRGGEDCPDWLLAEINSLSKLSSVKVRSLTSQLIKIQFLNGDDSSKSIQSLVREGDAKFDEETLSAACAAISFILTSAAKFETDAQTLQSELQQLGLPKEHSSSIGKVYAKHGPDIRLSLKKQSLRISSDVEEVKFRLSPDLPEILMSGVQGKDSKDEISLTPKMFLSLLDDLRAVRETIENVS